MTVPVYTMTVILLCRFPKALSSYLNLTAPFSWSLWLLIILFYLVSEITLYIIRRISGKEDGLPFFTIFTMMVAQGISMKSTASPSIQLLIMTWTITILFIHAFYDANLRKVATM